MKHALAFAALIVVSSCGNWSNEDLEYINALPTKETLEAQLKGASTSGQPLKGAGTKQQPLFGPNDNAPLNVGDPSTAYGDTVKTVSGINSMINLCVDVVLFIETIPPTTRTSTSRVWGPWADSSHPGFDVRVTINRNDVSHFTYAFEWRPANGAFFSLVDGAAVATMNLHRGSGAIHLHGKTARETPTFGGFDGVDEVDIGYDTSNFPTAVSVAAAATNDAGTFTVDFSQAANDAGALQFTLDPSPPLLDGGIAEIQSKTFWLPDGSGRQDGAVTKGDWKGVNGIECWDSAQAVTYQRWWDGTEHGDAGSCPASPF